MIADMSKYSFVVFHSDYESFLSDIKDLGVVHVKETNAEPTEEMQSVLRRIADVTAARKILITADKKATADNNLPTDGAQLVELIRQTKTERERIEQSIGLLDKDLQSYEPWGGRNLTTDALARLKQNGINVTLYKCAASRFNDKWAEEGAVEIVSQEGGVCYFAAFATESMPLPDIEAEEVVLPERSYAELEAAKTECLRQVEQLKQDQVAQALHAPAILDQYEASLADELQDLSVRQNSSDAADNSVKILEGYVPDESAEPLKQMLEAKHIVYLASAATPDEQPPIKLINSRFSHLFEPITEMFSLPNYSEIDPTPLFAPFFMLFFGLCLGDAGYGLIVLLVSIFAKRKVSEGMKGYCNLGIILGSATVVVSLITGMVFGIDLSQVEAIPPEIRKYFVTDTNFKIAGYSPMMVFAVAIGIVQILFGMCIKAAKYTKQQGRRYAISTISWVVVLPTLAVTFGLPAVGIELSQAVVYALYAVIALCCIGIFFFNSPDSGIVSNIGSGIWGTYNMATGLLGDTLSYIRLFALGLTGGILGSVFNSMALQAGEGLPWFAKFIVMLLILLAGHGINFGLCLIGAFVHPMRLTFVEFYKNAGFEGGGRQYKPFAKTN